MSHRPVPEHSASPGPGFLRSVLIHLGGGDPRVFHLLPAHESTDFAKMGASVLIPVVLALTAGTFTIAHFQRDPDWPVAIACGVVWSLVILTIDVAVMSQLVKNAPPLAPEPEREASPGARRAPLPVAPAPVAELPKLPWFRNKVIALMRISIAVVLGLFVSHSLVLALFHKQIDQTIEMKRAAILGADHVNQDHVNALQARLDEASAAFLIRDPEIFLERYQAYLEKQKSPPVAVSGTSKPPSAAPVDATASADQTTDRQILLLRQQLRDLMANQEEALAKLKNQQKLESDEYAALGSDYATAEKMLHDEQVVHTPQPVHFSTVQFSLLGTATSGKAGIGPNAEKIRAALAQAKGSLAKKKQDLEALGKQIADLTGVQTKACDEIYEAINKRNQEIRGTLRENELKAQSTLAETAATQHDKLKAEIDSLGVRLADARKVLADASAPFEGKDTDLLEQTGALVDWIFADDKVPDPYKRPIIIFLVGVTLLSIMLIDLTPLMIKLMRSPGAYDSYLAASRAKRVHLPSFLPPPDRTVTNTASRPPELSVTAPGAGHFSGPGDFRPPQRPRPAPPPPTDDGSSH